MLEAFKIGHSTDNENGTGVTVILCESGAIGGVSVRGSAPATRETDLLSPLNAVEKIQAVFLSGGSAFGLESASGIMRYLDEKKLGYPTSAKPVPIVCGASLYDLDYKNCAFPGIEAGFRACEDAKSDNFECGAIGAGTGATIGKIMGKMSATKSGLGCSAITLLDGTQMAAIVAVNAFGDVYDYKDGKRVGGAIIEGEDAEIMRLMTEGAKFLVSPNSNTTLGCIITNAKLTKSQANKLADIAHDGYAMSIRPVHTMVDGDAIFAMSSDEVEGNFMLISSIAPTLMAEAVLSAVRSIK